MRARRTSWLITVALVAGLSPAWGQSDVEPNNTCANAVASRPSLPLSIVGNLEAPSGDVDFYRFIGTPGSAVIATLQGSTVGQGTLQDPFLGRFDSSCQLVDVNDDGAGALNSRLGFTVPADGVFILAVTSCCDGDFSGASASGSYRLTLDPGGVIAGSIRDGAGRPLTPDLVAAFTQAGQFAASASVENGATYELLLPPGTYRVVAEGLGARRWYRNGGTLSAADAVTVRADERTTGIDITLSGRVQVRPRVNQRIFEPGETLRLDLEIHNPSASAASVVVSVMAVAPGEPEIEGFCCFEDRIGLVPATPFTVPGGAESVVAGVATHQFGPDAQRGGYAICATVIQDGITTERCEGFSVGREAADAAGGAPRSKPRPGPGK